VLTASRPESLEDEQARRKETIDSPFLALATWLALRIRNISGTEIFRRLHGTTFSFSEKSFHFQWDAANAFTDFWVLGRFCLALCLLLAVDSPMVAVDSPMHWVATVFRRRAAVRLLLCRDHDNSVGASVAIGR